MITVIRKQIQGKLTKIILWITLLALGGLFSLPALLNKGQKTTYSSWVIRVNGASIAYGDFMRNVAMQKDRLAQLRSQYGEYTDMMLASMGMSTNPREIALDYLVKGALFDQAAAAIPLKLHSDYVVESLNNPQFVMRELSELVPGYVFDQYGGINSRLLSSHLQRIGLSMKEFERKVEQELQRSLMSRLVAGAHYVPLFELKQQYLLEYLGKKFSLITFSFEQALKKAKAKTVTDKELKGFYDTHNAKTKRYWVPQKRSGTQWTFDPLSYGIAITDEQIETYYNDYKAKKFVQDPTKIQVRRILFKVDDPAMAQVMLTKAEETRETVLKDPSTFAQVAQELSDDKETAKDGGLVPFFSRGEKERAFDRTALLLKEDDEISKVIETSEGFEILQRVSKKLQTFKPLATVRKKIKDILTQQKFKELFGSDMQTFVAGETVDEAKLQAFIKAKGGKAKAMAPMTEDGSKLAKTFFTLKEGKIGFYIKGNNGIAVTLTKIDERHLPSLDAVKSVVQDDWYEQQAAEAITKQVQKAKQIALTEKSAQEIVAAAGGTLEQTALLKKDDTDAVDRLKKRNIPTERMFELAQVGAALVHDPASDMPTAVTSRNGYVVRLDEIEPFDQEQFALKKDTLKGDIERETVRFLLDGFVASLQRNATLETNESLLLSHEDYSV